MKTLSLALLFTVGGCAHHKPCIAVPPPEVSKPACAIHPESNEENLILICETPGFQKFLGDVHDLKQWATDTYGVCSK